MSGILDLKDNSIISFAIGRSNHNRLVFDTFDLAVSKYPDAHPIFHSDRGFQYTSKQFKTKLDKAGMTQSMSRVGRCIDNGLMEGFWGILKCEMYYLGNFKDYDHLAAVIENYIHFYNYNRRQKKLSKLAPMTYRQLLEDAA
ncbi:Integrase catalytic domain-containing protein [Marinicrinis lubricantis]